MEDNYNPYDNRDVKRPLSNCEAFMTLLKAIIGTGILALPMAFKFGGLAGGSLMTIFSTSLVVYGIQLMVECMFESSRRNQLGYMNLPESMAYALTVGPKCTQFFSKFIGIFVDILLCISHYGINVVYHVFVAINLHQLLENYGVNLDARIVSGIVGLFLLPLFLVRLLKYLVPSTIIANIFIYFGLAAIFYYMVRDIPPINDRRLFPKPLDVPLFIAIVLFSTSTVGVMLAVESNMAKPQRFLGLTGVLTLSAIIVCLTNIAFGFVGYWKFGNIIADTVTLNLPSEEILAQVIKMLILIAVFFSYPLSGYVSIDIIVNHWMSMKRPLENPHRAEYIVRFVFVIVCTVNAVAFPNLGPLVALVGAFAISTLNLILPCCMELCLYYNVSYGKFKWKLWKNIIIIKIGTIVLVYGSYTAIRAIISEYTK